MFAEFDQSEGNVAGLLLSGRMTDEDYALLADHIEGLIACYGRIRLLVQLRDFDGLDVQAAWSKFKFGLSQGKKIDRLAVVGEKPWQEMVSRLFQAFAGATIHYYRADQIDAAWTWVKDGWLESLVALSTKEHRA